MYFAQYKYLIIIIIIIISQMKIKPWQSVK